MITRPHELVQGCVAREARTGGAGTAASVVMLGQQLIQATRTASTASTQSTGTARTAQHSTANHITAQYSKPGDKELTKSSVSHLFLQGCLQRRLLLGKCLPGCRCSLRQLRL